MTMPTLVLGLILFMAPHSVAIVAPGWRARMRERIGEGGWKAGYSLLSGLGLVLIVWGYGLARAEPVPVYVPPPGARHVTMFLMLFVFPLLLAAYLPGRIRAAVRHPMLIGVGIWGAAHLLANGMLADVLLFGAFLLWAVADLLALGLGRGGGNPTLPASPANDAIAVVGGLLLYGAFVLWLHPLLIGVPV